MPDCEHSGGVVAFQDTLTVFMIAALQTLSSKGHSCEDDDHPRLLITLKFLAPAASAALGAKFGARETVIYLARKEQ